MRSRLRIRSAFDGFSTGAAISFEAARGDWSVSAGWSGEGAEPARAFANCAIVLFKPGRRAIARACGRPWRPIKAIKSTSLRALERMRSGAAMSTVSSPLWRALTLSRPTN